MTIHTVYNGEFGKSSAAKFEKSVEGSSVQIYNQHELDVIDLQNNITDGDQAIVFSSSLDTASVATLASLFQQCNMRWTSAYLGPRYLRVGPVVESNHSPCFDCSTKRYISDPGSECLSRLEYFVHTSNNCPENFEFDCFLPSTISLAVFESIRQLSHLALTNGFIRKIDLLTLQVDDAQACAVHGCECLGQDKQSSATRFYKNLSSDVSFLFDKDY